MADDKDCGEALQSTGAKVLEDWAMMLVDPAEDTQIFEAESPFYFGTVEFAGPKKGTVCIVVQDQFMDSLTRNLLGLDPSVAVTEADKQDALKEMSNVLTGNFLTEAFGSVDVFDVVLPLVHKVGYDVVEKVLKNTSDSRKALYYLADGEPVAFTFESE